MKIWILVGLLEIEWGNDCKEEMDCILWLDRWMCKENGGNKVYFKVLEGNSKELLVEMGSLVRKLILGERLWVWVLKMWRYSVGY